MFPAFLQFQFNSVSGGKEYLRPPQLLEAHCFLLMAVTSVQVALPFQEPTGLVCCKTAVNY